MSKLDTTIQELIVKLRTVEGLGHTPDYPPEKIGGFPFVVVYSGSARHLWNTSDDTRALRDIIIEVHVARRDLGYDVQQALIYAENIPLIPFTMVKDEDFTQVDTFEEVTSEFIGLGWDVPTMGFRFTITQVKIKTDIP